MATAQPIQTFANHRRRLPLYFALAFLVVAAEFVHRIIHLFRHPGLIPAWEVLVWLALLAIAFAARRSAQIVQDRVIRDEMLLRLERVLGPGRTGEIAALTLPQLVGLRFASDAELPTLVAEVAAGRLTKVDDIKRKIVQWQADWLRV
jgi:hypothetical protein